jgi:hypothetical protein
MIAWQNSRRIDIAAIPRPSYPAHNMYARRFALRSLFSVASSVAILVPAFSGFAQETPPEVTTEASVETSTSAVTSVDAVSQRSPDDRFKAAATYFEEGEYKKAQEMLDDLLFPKPAIEGADKIARAHVLLSAAYLALGNMKAADGVVKVIIEGDVNFRFDSDYDPSLLAMAERHRTARLQALEMSTIDILLHILPFGVGQFVDGRYVAGSIYFALQTGLATYAGMKFLEFRDERGKCTNSTSSQFNDCPITATGEILADQAKTVNNIAQGVFVASMVLSVAESFMFRPIPASAPKASVQPAVSFNILPSKGGGAASLTLSF